MHCQADEHFSGSYTAASPAVTLLAVTSLAAASALMDDPDAARLKLGNLVKEITPSKPLSPSSRVPASRQPGVSKRRESQWLMLS